MHWNILKVQLLMKDDMPSLIPIMVGMQSRLKWVEDRNSRSILVEVEPVYKDGRISSFPSPPQGETQLHLIDLEMPTYGAVFEVQEPSCEFLKDLVMTNNHERLVLKSKEELAEGLTQTVCLRVHEWRDILRLEDSQRRHRLEVYNK